MTTTTMRADGLGVAVMAPATARTARMATAMVEAMAEGGVVGATAKAAGAMSMATAMMQLAGGAPARKARKARAARTARMGPAAMGTAVAAAAEAAQEAAYTVKTVGAVPGEMERIPTAMGAAAAAAR